MATQKTEDYSDNDYAIGKVTGWYDKLKADRLQFEKNAYIVERFYRGHHYDLWDKFNKTLVTPQPRKGEVRLSIPILKVLTDVAVSQLVAEDPEWMVTPENTTDEGLQEARWNQDLLSAVWEKSEMREKLRQVIKSAFMKSVGIVQVQFNPELEKHGEIEFNVVRPEDFYIPLSSQDPANAPIVVKTFAKDLDAIKNSELYKKTKKNWIDDLRPDGLTTDASYLQQLRAEEYNSDERVQDQDQSSVLLAEAYIRYYPKDQTNPKYRIVTFAVKQRKLLRNEETDLDAPPFFVLHSDRHSNEFYGIGKALPIVALNKSYDNIASRIQEHIHKFTRGVMLVPRGASLFRTSNEAGELWLYNQGRAPTAENPPAMPAEWQHQLEVLREQMQDATGVHDISLGRLPQGVRSARAIEALQYGDQIAKADIKFSRDRFLGKMGRYVLNLISQHYTKQRIVSIYTDAGDYKKFAAVGQNASNPYIKQLQQKQQGLPQQQQTPLVIVKPDNDVRVEVGSGLANTPEARQEKAMSMLQMGLLSRESVLRYFNVGNVAEEASKALDDAIVAQEVQKDQQPQKDTKDYVNTKLTDLAPSERAQYLKEIGIQPEQDPTQIPNSPDAQHSLTQNKMLGELDNKMALAQHQSHLNESQKVSESINPLMQGGIADLTAEDQLGQDQQPAGPPESQAPADLTNPFDLTYNHPQPLPGGKRARKRKNKGK